MQIKLKLDYDGKPYLELKSATGSGRDVDDEVLELFIREAFEKGVVIYNEAGEATRDDYASIRI